MFSAAAFSTAKTWKQLRCPSTDDRINKAWSAHTVEYYSALRRRDLLAWAMTQMNLGDIYDMDEP